MKSIKIVLLIDGSEIVKKILKHLDLWEPPPRVYSPPPPNPLSSVMSAHRPTRMISRSMCNTRLNLIFKICRLWTNWWVQPEFAQILNSTWKNHSWQSNLPPLSDWVLLSFNWCLNMLSCSWSRYTIRKFLLMHTEKAMSYLFDTLILSQSAEGLKRPLSMEVENEKFKGWQKGLGIFKTSWEF